MPDAPFQIALIDQGSSATKGALATSQGDFALAMALGLVLLALALTVNVLLQLFQGRGDA